MKCHGQICSLLYHLYSRHPLAINVKTFRSFYNVWLFCYLFFIFIFFGCFDSAERLDQDMGGILTTICNHSFHCSCISKWTDSSCPVSATAKSSLLISHKRLLNTLLWNHKTFLILNLLFGGNIK